MNNFKLISVNLSFGLGEVCHFANLHGIAEYAFKFEYIDRHRTIAIFKVPNDMVEQVEIRLGLRAARINSRGVI